MQNLHCGCPILCATILPMRFHHCFSRKGWEAQCLRQITLAAALAEEPDAIEDIYEPYLIQLGFLDKTPRGRVATKLAYDHFGIPITGKSSLF